MNADGTAAGGSLLLAIVSSCPRPSAFICGSASLRKNEGSVTFRNHASNVSL
jgi:hypothetical protein